MKDRAPIFIALSDLLICLLCYVLIAVAPSNAKTDGVKPKAEFLITADWPVERDVDLDLWVAGPSHKPVFYNSRQVGCADLDRDSLGYSTSMIYLENGSQVRSRANIETITLRCIEHGHYDVAVNLFSYHSDRGEPITAHLEVTKLNPNVRTIWAGDVTLKHLGETHNAISFDLDKDGDVTLVPTPLEPVTAAYEKAKTVNAP